jgi:hypothetical protein
MIINQINEAPHEKPGSFNFSINFERRTQCNPEGGVFRQPSSLPGPNARD